MQFTIRLLKKKYFPRDILEVELFIFYFQDVLSNFAAESIYLFIYWLIDQFSALNLYFSYHPNVNKYLFIFYFWNISRSVSLNNKCHKVNIFLLKTEKYPRSHNESLVTYWDHILSHIQMLIDANRQKKKNNINFV